MNDETVLRKQAIALYLKGASVIKISEVLGKTRQWVYKWLKRYNTGESEWADSQSRAPKTSVKQISNQTEEAIVSVRKSLSGHKYAQKGALSILYEFERLNIKAPSVATINRVLKRNDLIEKGDTRVAKKKEYPNSFCNVQQMDLIGPKYLKGGFRYYLLDIIDIETHFAGVYPILNKSTESIVPAVSKFWMDFSMPDYFQMDNELSFRGSNRYPRSFGPLIRLALSQNIVPIFIPPAEPWRNGIIEKFNDTVQKYLINTQTFTCFRELEEHSRDFSTFHNKNHHYSILQGKTPQQMISGINRFKLNTIPEMNRKIPLEEGEIIFIRFIRSDCIIRILDARFDLKKELIYSYVIARIIVKSHVLQIERDNIIHHIFPFVMPVDW